YTLDLNTEKSVYYLIFNSITLDSFKVNIIERYTGKMNFNQILCEVIFKVRTLENELIQRRDGNLRVKIKDEKFETYQELSKVLSSYNYKNKLLNRKEADQNYVHFMLSMLIQHYELN
ncbi:MAG: prevent-host-death protein, partial [Chryseobacterium sp.]